MALTSKFLSREASMALTSGQEAVLKQQIAAAEAEGRKDEADKLRKELEKAKEA